VTGDAQLYPNSIEKYNGRYSKVTKIVPLKRRFKFEMVSKREGFWCIKCSGFPPLS